MIKLKGLGEIKDKITPADTVTLLATLDVPLGKKTIKQFRDWLSALSDEDRLDYLYDVSQFAGQLGLALDKLDQGSDALSKKKREALYFYALAVWRAFELKAKK